MMFIFADGVVPVVKWECDLFEETDSDEAASHKIDLSVVVPAYNEEERLPAMLDQAIEFLDNPKVSLKLVAEGSDQINQVLCQKMLQIVNLFCRSTQVSRLGR